MNEIMIWLAIDVVLAAVLLGCLYVGHRRDRALSEALGHMFKARIELMDKALNAGDEDGFKMLQQSGRDIAKFTGQILS